MFKGWFNRMKGIILAGGKGTRLAPLTKITSKHLLPIYDKPMIYYPLSILLLAGIKEILIISTGVDKPLYERLLGDGSKIGIRLNYAIQEEPRGLAEAFIIGEDFIENDSVCLILGDNILFGQDLSRLLSEAANLKDGALVFAYPVKNPSEFGVVEFDANLNVISIIEKPLKPKSDYAIPGIYFYDNSVIKKAKRVHPSGRGELEISSLNNIYLDESNLRVKLLGRGYAWLDTGTLESMKFASEFVEVIQKRQGFYISCIEEISWRKGYINNSQLKQIGIEMSQSDYGKYILSLLEN
jgi:glucose-1-phosphate thymidylyltransferase